MQETLTASDVARAATDALGETVSPRDVSNLFYVRVLDDRSCPIVGGRRLIPRSYLPTLMQELRRRVALRRTGGAS